MIKIFDKYTNKDLKKFRDIVIKEFYNKNKKFDNDLSNLHKVINKKEVNNFRLHVFQKINKLNWQKMLLNIASNEIFNLLGQDLLVQTKLNLSIQMPNDETSLLPIHSDSWSADSPFQINLWIPLTNAFGTNSMFIKDKKLSISVFKKIGSKQKINLSKIKILKNDFIKMNFGQILIFNPILLHGNVKNNTNSTRISLNVRIKSMFSPEPSTRNSDRKYGAYYKTLNVSENTELALQSLKTGFLD